MARIGNLGGRLYRGELSFDIVGRRKRWYLVSAVLLILSVAFVLLRGGLNFSVDFTGGSVFQFPASGTSVSEIRSVVAEAPGTEAVPTVQEIGNDRWRVQTESLTSDEVAGVQDALANELGIDPSTVSPQSVGPSWGQQISQKALLSLGVFLALLVVYLSVAFEWKMAVAAIAALLHDLVITIGIYALVGFEVTPATVIGLLTILGFSLYDTVVVFDKVRENTAGLLGGARMNYSQAANLALNQVLVRSINTSVVALLPVAAILFVGAGLLGAGTLKDLSLVLMVGTAVGAYSSVLLATPLLSDMKEREPQFQALARRVAARQGGGAGKAAKRRTAAADKPQGSEKPAAAADEPVSGAAAADEPTPETVGAGAQRRSPQYGPRQQPRRTSKSKRRPSGKKRR